MLMRNFLSSRKSVREFKAKNLSSKSVKDVQGLIETVHQKVDQNQVTYTFVENGKELAKTLEGKGGYAGVMIKAPAYIAMDIHQPSDAAHFMGAYFMEEIISGLLDLGLASCWISLANVDDAGHEALKGFSIDHADYLLAIGYPNNNAAIGEQVYSSRLGVEDIVYKNNIGTPMTLEELEALGLDDLFYYVRFAPSQYNEQPWRYVVNNGKIDMYVKDTGKNYWIEAGIAAYYLEQLVHTMNIPHRFVLAQPESNGEYNLIGSIQV